MVFYFFIKSSGYVIFFAQNIKTKHDERVFLSPIPIAHIKNYEETEEFGK